VLSFGPIVAEKIIDNDRRFFCQLDRWEECA
jgi:hypothetical protein